jgi:mannose-1-phosphate guanylyltransferase
MPCWGGVGTGAWPLSQSQPKQYLDIFDGKSLFEMTVDRNKILPIRSWSWVMTTAILSEKVLEKKILILIL